MNQRPFDHESDAELLHHQDKIQPENIGGWRPQCGWLWHRWVCYSCRLRGHSKVRSFGQWAAATCAAPPSVNCRSVRHFEL